MMPPFLLGNSTTFKQLAIKRLQDNSTKDVTKQFKAELNAMEG